jgi:hypothetical protein
MAVILSMTYQKKLGLPNFSSHSCQVSLTVEIPDVSAAAQESAKLYQLLQAAVDQEIQQVGFMPDATVYGMNHPENNGHSRNGSNGHRSPDAWNCTDGQKGFIIRLVNDSNLDKNEVEGIAQQLFNAGVKQLDRMQASQLIEELLEKTGRKTNGRPRFRREPVRH